MTTALFGPTVYTFPILLFSQTLSLIFLQMSAGSIKNPKLLIVIVSRTLSNYWARNCPDCTFTYYRFRTHNLFILYNVHVQYIHNGETCVESVWYTVYRKEVYMGWSVSMQLPALYKYKICIASGFAPRYMPGRCAHLCVYRFVTAQNGALRAPPYLYVNVCVAPPVRLMILVWVKIRESIQ